ncbi:MAG TPA: response regulator transcription factor [Pseudonocardiaceae bacterium]|nr:response regulator transcription factor [Pseudonocardiaceae bacterium]
MRVVVVDDNDVWRPSLVAALASGGITVVAETSDGMELLMLLPSLGPEPIDIAVLDLRLPPTWSDEGIQLARELRRRYQELGVIILSGYERDVQLHHATQALSHLGGHGGMGYLFKDRTSRSSLRSAIHRVATGRLVVDPLFSQQATAEYRDQHSATKDFSDREVEVLDLLVQGLTNKEIADTLYLSIPAVERHLTKIFRQLLPAEISGESSVDTRRENRRVLTVLEWLRRTGHLT